METDLLLPGPDEDTEPFWDGTREHELRVQACTACGGLRFPPRPMCPECSALDHEWRTLSGRGKVWSYIVAHPPLLPAYAEFAPYPVVTVELDEDPTIRMVGNVVTEAGAPINSVDPAEIEIGRAVQVTFEQVSDEITLPRWVFAD